MNRDHRIPLLLLVNFVFAFAFHQVNDLLAPFSVQLRLEGLFIALPVLYFRLLPGLAVVALTGLFSMAPTPLGATAGAVLFTATALLAYARRGSFRRENPVHLTALALALNAVLFALAGAFSPLPAGDFWLSRAAADLALSECAILFCAAKFVEFQRHLLLTSGIDLAAELQSF